MSITEQMKERDISFQNVIENIAGSNTTVIGVLRKKLPDIVVEIIINYIGARFTFYGSPYGSNYYKHNIKALLSWPTWRGRNNLFSLSPCESDLRRLRVQGMRELENERMSQLIYGF